MIIEKISKVCNEYLKSMEKEIYKIEVDGPKVIILNRLKKFLKTCEKESLNENKNDEIPSSNTKGINNDDAKD